MTELIVADAGPLIGMARIGLLFLLRELYGKVLIPTQVLTELKVFSQRPGAQALSEASREGWLVEVAVAQTDELDRLKRIVDPGEAEAIALAQQQSARLILIDERNGRILAEELGLRVIGTGGVLLEAKQKNLIDRVGVAIDQLTSGGYRLAPSLCAQILRKAGEV